MLAGAGTAMAMNAPDGPPADKSGGGRELSVTGSMKGLYPGHNRFGRLVVRNHGARRLMLRSLGARIGDAAPGCGASLLRVRTFPGDRLLPPRRKARVPVIYTLKKGAGDACIGARFPIRWRARAVSG